MAKLAISGYKEFDLWNSGSRYFRVYVTLTGKESTLQGEVIFHIEKNKLSFRWMRPSQLDEIDQKWDEKIMKECEQYLLKKGVIKDVS